MDSSVSTGCVWTPSSSASVSQWATGKSVGCWVLLQCNTASHCRELSSAFCTSSLSFSAYLFVLFFFVLFCSEILFPPPVFLPQKTTEALSLLSLPCNMSWLIQGFLLPLLQRSLRVILGAGVLNTQPTAPFLHQHTHSQIRVGPCSLCHTPCGWIRPISQI